MALVLIEGFDHYTAAEATLKGWNTSFSGMTTGRLGGAGSQAATLSNRNAQLTFTATPFSTFIVGCAVYFASTTTAGKDFLGLYSGTTRVAALSFNASGILQVENNSGTVVATGSSVISIGVWYYVELKVVVGSSGSCEMRLNGASEISSTTGNFGTSNIDTVFLGWQLSTQYVYFDDLYGCDTSGSVNNDFLGDIRVETIRPDGDGAHTDLTPNSGSTHYTQVDDATPDDDTTYVYGQTVGDRDSYGFGNLEELTGTIYGLQTVLYARKDTSGTKQIAAVARPSSTDDDGATSTLTTSYLCYTEIRETNPDTSAAWTIADVNGSEFGVKIVT